MNESDRIEAYIRGDLNRSELERFELELESDPGLRNRLEEARVTIDLIEAHAFQLKKSELARQLALRKKRKYITAFLLLAGVLIFIMTLMIFLGKDIEDSNSPDQLYAQHMKEYKMLGVSRGVGQTFLFEVQSAYFEKDYETVIRLTDKVDSLDINLFMVRAVSQMNIETWQDALTTLGLAKRSAPIPYQNALLYYEGLVYLKLQDIDKAKTNFQTLAGTNSSYSKDAGAILKNL